MLRILKWIGIVAVVAIVGVLVYAATLPDTFRVERTVSIKAPPEKIFAHVNDLPSWRAWSPFEKLDPDMKRTFDGPSAGKGAIYGWDGNSSAGAGSMEIVESTPPSNVKILLKFTRPMEDQATAEFLLKSQGENTEVTWAMYGPNTYMGKVMQVFCSMDRMIGKEFEEGLSNLKTVAEK